jgi:hypothetical protein
MPDDPPDPLLPLLATLRAEAAAAPKFGLNGKALVLQAARAVAADEERERAARVAAADARLRQEQPRPSRPAAAQPQQHSPPRLSPAQLLALVPTAARPFLPYNPRAFLPLAERQAVVDRLVGLHLHALVRALGLPDGAVDGGGQAAAFSASSKLAPSSSKSKGIMGATAAARRAGQETGEAQRARLLWQAASASALGQERSLYERHASKPAYMAATLKLEAEVGRWEETQGGGEGGAAAAAVQALRREAGGGGEEEEEEDGDKAGAGGRREEQQQHGVDDDKG